VAEVAAAAVTALEDPAQVQRMLWRIRQVAHEAAVGVPVDTAALMLDVSQPTVRSWVERGILTSVPGQRPVRVTADSLGDTLAAVTALRRADSAGPLAGRVLAVLHDRHIRADVAARLVEIELDDVADVNLDALFS
jgi:hypothetical protein